MKISFFEITKEEKGKLMEEFTGHDCNFFEVKLTAYTAHLAKDSEMVSVFVNSMVTKDVIEAIPNLKFISTRSTGFDHIDTAFAKSKNIKVSNVPSYGSRTVAEFTFALILELSRKVHLANKHMKDKVNCDISDLRGFDLCGKTLGVVGTGKIGKNVVKIAKGFDMKVVAFDAFPDLNFAKENGFEYATLMDLLSQSDIVSLHTPYNKDTHHFINMESIKDFKSGSYLINTARGEIVETKALMYGLEEKIIAGAGLDVLEEERRLKENMDDTENLHEDRKLINMPNVIVTPHVAFSSNEAEAEILRVTVDNILSFINNSPKNIVN